MLKNDNINIIIIMNNNQIDSPINNILENLNSKDTDP